MKKKKIAIVAKNLDVNGITSVILNHFKILDLEKADINLFVGEIVNTDYKLYCQKLGIRVIELPNKDKSKVGYYYELYSYLKKKKYDIFYLHGNSSIMIIELFIAKLCGIRMRIAHCHTSITNRKILDNLLNPLFNKLCVKRIACSKKAGEWIFRNNKYIILNNFFEIQNYKFDFELRKKWRKKLNIENNLVIGHVGGLNDTKNQEFLIKVFEKLLNEKNRNLILLLIGEGNNRKKLERMINNSKYKKNIILYGTTHDVQGVLSSMDIFAFPSKYEGLGLAVVEAQISGLYSIASKEVPSDVKIGENIVFEGIKSLIDIEEWRKDIENFIKKIKEKDYLLRREKYFFNNYKDIKKYDIQNNFNLLNEIYFSDWRDIE